MNQNSLQRNYNYRTANFGKLEENSISFNRQSFQIQHFPASSSRISSNGGSPRAEFLNKHVHVTTKSNQNDPNNGIRENSKLNNDVSKNRNMRYKKRINLFSREKLSPGPIYSIGTKKELSSIDKINDPAANTLVCAGKTHLGLYKFSPQKKSISLVHDFMSTNQSSQGIIKRNKQVKLSTIADVKTGYYNYKNYVAVSSNSTVISIYDINRSKSTNNPLVSSFQQHTRSINSFDFNMVHTNLIISGGQDGCIKIWDLRSNNPNRCDVSISTSSDSVRDVKWMPYHNFSSTPTGGLEASSENSMGYKFASIHDSGLLLKFDIRQPNQVEQKINAHTGPGLCLNWHPNLNYITTGGRDGKLCVWNLGDRNISDISTTPTSLSTPFSLGTGNTTSLNSIILPEITINTGFPVTKLKFRPAYVKNLVNSLFATSSMGEEAGVSVYSLARKYIPKHTLMTSSPSLGLVWWDDSIIFNIDRNYTINGWDLDEEPTVLDNMPKSKVTWRDIDGHGLLFINQNMGGYDVPDSVIKNIQLREKAPNGRVKLNNFINSNVSAGNTRLIDSLKKGMSYSALSSLGNERPSKPVPTMSNKSLSTISANSSHNNSVISSPLTYAFNNDQKSHQNIPSPLLIPLNLPHIINDMRLSRFPKNKQKLCTPEIKAIKESPIEVFQFLAKELEFSSVQEKQIEESKLTKKTLRKYDEESENDLMKRFGLGDMTTWTNLISKKTDDDQSSTNNSDDENESDNISYTDGEYTIPDNNSSIMTKSTVKLSKTITANSTFKQKTELLFRLVTICNHNASVYSFIDDLSNFKIWILIRDSLLWDLKWLCGSSLDPTADGQEELGDNHLKRTNGITPIQLGKDVSVSDTESLENIKNGSENIVNPYLNEKVIQYIPKKEKEPMKKSKSLVSDFGDQISHHSNLKKQLLLEKKKLQFDSVSNGDDNKLKDNKSKKSEMLQTETSPFYANHLIEDGSRGTELKEVSTTTTDGEHALDSNNSSHSSKEIKSDNENKIQTSRSISMVKESYYPNGIPIVNKRKPRTSFVDTFMPDPRSLGGIIDTSVLSNSKSSRSFDRSPTSKFTSTKEFQANASQSIAIMTKMSHTRSLDESPGNRFKDGPFAQGVFATEFMESLQSLRKWDSPQFEDEKSRVIAPWNTNRLLRQLFSQATESGNILLAINILTLFQNIYEVTGTDIVKNCFSQFINLLHRYELFEIASAQLKYSPWFDIFESDTRHDEFQIYCESCGKLVTNSPSKEKCSEEFQNTGDPAALERFGYWYCDSCRKPNTLCVICEQPMKKLAICLLECGHEFHFECGQQWFLEEKMDECPAGCLYSPPI